MMVGMMRATRARAGGCPASPSSERSSVRRSGSKRSLRAALEDSMRKRGGSQRSSLDLGSPKTNQAPYLGSPRR